jgi:HK97 family phage major capsid protein
MNMHRVRGIVQIQANYNSGGPSAAQINATIEETAQAVADFKNRHMKRVDQIEAMVNNQAEKIDALRVGAGAGLGVHPGAGLRLPGLGAPAITGNDREEILNAMRGMPSAGMSSQVGPDGGFTVSPVVDTTIDALMRNASVMRSMARNVVITDGGSWQKIVGRSGTQSGWAGEEDTRADTDGPTLGLVTITPWELFAMPEMTNHLMEDSGFDLESFLTEDVTAELALQEGSAFVAGNGVKKPFGFLSYNKVTTADATRAFGALQYVFTGNATGFGTTAPADALHDLLTSLRPVYRAGDGVAWIMNSATANIVRKFKDGQGNYLWTPSLALGQPDRLMGYPVAIDEAMPDVAANAFPIAFGNWRRGYAIVDKPGLRLIADRVTKKGWTKMYFSRRTGGGVVDSNAIKLLRIATS